MYPIPVSSVRALPEDYFETTLKGRVIASQDEVLNLLWGEEENTLFIENQDPQKIRLHLNSTLSSPLLEYADGASRSFLDIYGAKIIASKAESTAYFEKRKNKELVVTRDGVVIGTIIGRTSDDNDQNALLIAPAYAFITPPPEHIREHLKLMKDFKRAPLDEHQIFPLKSGMEIDLKVHIEGSPERIGGYTTSGQTVTIDDVEYTDAFLTQSFSEATSETPETLQEAYKNALCARPEDIGKLVVSRDAKQVVGVLVKEEVHYSSDHKRWYQKAYFCSAYDVFRP